LDTTLYLFMEQLHIEDNDYLHDTLCPDLSF